ncbi:hypothetical protein SAMN06272759_11415 [Novosphingobium sp. B1]|nr:hypothetical protein SAMN06272759_11415 [Novosphingobium sp. B1]
MSLAIALMKSIFARALHMVSCLKQLTHHTSGNAMILIALGLPTFIGGAGGQHKLF